MEISEHNNVDVISYLKNGEYGGVSSEYERNEVLFRQGDLSGSIYYIISGKVELRIVSSGGKGAVVAVLSEADFVGESCLTGQTDRNATAIAITPCRITRLEKAAFERTLSAEPSLMAFFLSRVLRRNIVLEEELVEQLFEPSEKRLARALLRLAGERSDGNVYATMGKISQETLAEMIGTTRSRVSHFMNQFRKHGLVEYNGHLLVHAAVIRRFLEDQA